MDDKEIKRKQLLFRSHHRGINEMDKLLQAFAEAELATLNEALLAAYERLLDGPDLDTYEWLTGQVAPPDDLVQIVGLIRKNIAS